MEVCSIVSEFGPRTVCYFRYVCLCRGCVTKLTFIDESAILRSGIFSAPLFAPAELFVARPHTWRVDVE